MKSRLVDASRPFSIVEVYTKLYLLFVKVWQKVLSIIEHFVSSQLEQVLIHILKRVIRNYYIIIISNTDLAS